MCELFALNTTSSYVANDYLEEFYSHSTIHRHGWGLCYRDPQEPSKLHFWKEGEPAYSSELLPQLISNPIKAQHLQAHIRLATEGGVCKENSHPFVGQDMLGREWTLIHNGILFNEGLLWGYQDKETGQTDSERVILYLIDVIDEAILRAQAPVELDEKTLFKTTFNALTGAITQLGNHNKLNLILDDGTYTYVHTNTDEATLHFKEIDEGIMLSTQPLLDDSSSWKPVPQNRVIAYKNGRLIKASAPHGNVFCEAILDARRALLMSSEADALLNA